jgi:mannose-1-phosphate guanylyltransferase
VKGFILAAGFGERLRPITEHIPKSLIPVLNLPSICYAVFLLKEAGIDDVICNLHYRHQDIVDFFKENDFFDLNITFSVEESILGTGGGVKRCEGFIGNSDFVLINSDIIMDMDLRELIAYHERRSSPATVVLYRTERAGDIGPVSIEDDIVRDFQNTLPSGMASDLIYTGLAVLSPLIFRYLKNRFSSIVNTGYQRLIEDHTIGYLVHQGMWMDIGTIHSYWRANLEMVGNGGNILERLSSALGITPRVISSGAHVADGSVILNSIVGEGARVGKNSVVENSVLLPNSVVRDESTIVDAVVYGENVIQVSKS